MLFAFSYEKKNGVSFESSKMVIKNLILEFNNSMKFKGTIPVGD
jgi:hypothetical protein